MKRYLPVTACILLGMLLSASAALAKRTILCGSVDKNEGTNVVLNYYATYADQIDGFTTRVEAEVDDQKQFRFVLDLDEVIAFHLIYGKSLSGVSNYLVINKYLAPGDSLYLGFSGNNTTIDGDCEVCTALLMEWENQFLASNNARSSRELRQKLDPGRFFPAADSDRVAQLQFMDTYLKDKTVPETFRRFLTAEVNYRYATDLLQYSRARPNVMNTPLFRTCLSKVTIQDTGMLVSSYYVFFLRELPYSIWHDYTFNHKEDSWYHKDGMERQNAMRDSIARSYFNGKIYDIALYWILQEAIGWVRFGKGTPMYEQACRSADSLLTRYKNSFSDRSYHKRLVTGLSVFKDEGPAKDFTLTDLSGKQVSLSDYKGKVVYIDFWATNCAPCVAELPYMKKLMDHYKNEKVVFLFVSLGDPKRKLEDYLKKHGLQGIHLMEPQGLGSKVANDYHINAIPRYMVVDEKGMLLSTNAPRPSNHPEVLLDNALKLYEMSSR